MVGFTLPVERIQSDNKGKIDTKRALTNRNLHCKETIQCNLKGFEMVIIYAKPTAL